MSDIKKEIEAEGQDVEAAIKAGLQILGANRSDVIVEVVDEGSRGLLGIGSRNAVVRLTSMVVSKPKKSRPAKVVAVAPVATAREEAKVEKSETESREDNEEMETVAVEVMQELLDKMHVSATVSAHLSEPDDLTGKQIYVLDIQGNDLGMLIGVRGETLNALQHISRLMIGHRLQRRADFVVDIQGYRARREGALARLAERMAKKVSARKRLVSLEPMSPYERRIIHITLRDDEQVYTQSTGEGNRRRVQILPKQD